MWNLFIITVLASLTGMYVNSGERVISVVERNEAKEMAESMALYREAVVQYYTANDITKHSVGLEVLKTANLVPAWSTLYTRSAESIWANYRAADGTIYVYAERPPTINIQAELARLSRNSYLVGVYQKKGKILYSPVFGDTGISLAALASKAVQDNAPVWIGYRR
jgi:hypothetical protein